MATNQLTKLAAMLLISAVMLAPQGSRAQTPNCSPVQSVLSACRTYIFFNGAAPVRGSPCCNAVASLASAPTKAARQAVCSCLNKITSVAQDAQVKNAARLPGICGIRVQFAIQRNINCSRVK